MPGRVAKLGRTVQHVRRGDVAVDKVRPRVHYYQLQYVVRHQTPKEGDQELVELVVTACYNEHERDDEVGLPVTDVTEELRQTRQPGGFSARKLLQKLR